MKKSIIIIIVIIIIAIVSSYLIWKNHVNSASYALKQIELSIEEKNSLKFERYVNVDAFCEQTIDASLQQVITENFSKNQSGLEALGGALGLSLVEKIKPTLISLLRSSIIESVEKGNFNDLYNKKDDSKNISLGIIENILEVSPENLLEVEELNVEGDVGYFTLKFDNPILDTNLFLRLKMEKMNGNWKLNGFYNIQSYMLKLTELKNEKLAVINEEIRNRIDSLIEFDEIKTRSARYNYSTYVELKLKVTNRSEADTIDLLKVYPDYYGEVDESKYFFYGDIPPKSSKTDKIEFRYNEYIDLHTGFRYGDLKPTIEDLYVTSYDGHFSIIKEYKTWDEYKRSLPSEPE